MVAALKIIVADTSHVDVLSAIGAETFVEAYAVTLSAEDLEEYVTEAFAAERIRDEIDRSLATYLLCTDGGDAVCGYSKYIATEPPGCVAAEGAIELQRLYVRDGYRGRGIGGLLARRGEAVVREQGHAAIWLQVWEGNVAAQDVYLKWGYSFCGEQMYAVGSERRKVLIMSKMLDSGG